MKNCDLAQACECAKSDACTWGKKCFGQKVVRVQGNRRSRYFLTCFKCCLPSCFVLFTDLEECDKNVPQLYVRNGVKRKVAQWQTGKTTSFRSMVLTSKPSLATHTQWEKKTSDTSYKQQDGNSEIIFLNVFLLPWTQPSYSFGELGFILKIVKWQLSNHITMCICISFAHTLCR